MRRSMPEMRLPKPLSHAFNFGYLLLILGCEIVQDDRRARIAAFIA